tara:strand:+ start:1486 stop:2061 length:576 start_codon:yes stop_codon:yes gene_type:complete
MIDEKARMALQPELDFGERLLWAARPSPLRYALRRGWSPTLMAIPWIAFIAFWLFGFTGGFTDEGPDFTGSFGAVAIAFGSIFLFSGLGMLLTIPREFLNALSTSYGLTPQRGVIRAGVFRKTVTTLRPHTLEVLERKGERHGSLAIATDRNVTPSGLVVPGWTSWEERGFFNIANPAEVEQLIRTQVKDD